MTALSMRSEAKYLISVHGSIEETSGENQNQFSKSLRLNKIIKGPSIYHLGLLGRIILRGVIGEEKTQNAQCDLPDFSAEGIYAGLKKRQ